MDAMIQGHVQEEYVMKHRRRKICKDIKMIKMEKKDAQRIKRNRARSDRRRRAHQRLMAAEEEGTHQDATEEVVPRNGNKL